MVVRVAQWTVDVKDVDLMARFWSDAFTDIDADPRNLLVVAEHNAPL